MPAALSYVFEHDGEVSPECTLPELKQMHDDGAPAARRPPPPRRAAAPIDRHSPHTCTEGAECDRGGPLRR